VDEAERVILQRVLEQPGPLCREQMRDEYSKAEVEAEFESPRAEPYGATDVFGRFGS